MGGSTIIPAGKIENVPATDNIDSSNPMSGRAAEEPSSIAKASKSWFEFGTQALSSIPFIGKNFGSSKPRKLALCVKSESEIMDWLVLYYNNYAFYSNTKNSYNKNYGSYKDVPHEIRILATNDPRPSTVNAFYDLIRQHPKTYDKPLRFPSFLEMDDLDDINDFVRDKLTAINTLTPSERQAIAFILQNTAYHLANHRNGPKIEGKEEFPTILLAYSHSISGDNSDDYLNQTNLLKWAAMLTRTPQRIKID